MGLMQSKNQQSGLNRCACICNTVDHYKICVTQPVSSSPTPYRTTVFSGNPYYSKVNQQVTGKRWFSLDSTKMSNRQLSGSDLLKDNRQNKVSLKCIFHIIPLIFCQPLSLFKFKGSFFYSLIFYHRHFNSYSFPLH